VEYGRGLVALAGAREVQRDAAEVLGVGRKLERVARVIGGQVRDQQQRFAFSLHLVLDREPVDVDLRHGRSLPAVATGLRTRRSPVNPNGQLCPIAQAAEVEALYA
jgi:hypothetical protein